ncbi:general substrate transporter [Boeremia exigua]|uniref:general substrate transporter n=1 Tax=Boeremia exigua TaxID=749465 RepID=UPI001E8EAE44|nr:general substrate transporter [Boeremia exigua]KAH6643101.1 general substrate transporter [Boeremia exigua]
MWIISLYKAGRNQVMLNDMPIMSKTHSRCDSTHETGKVKIATEFIEDIVVQPPSTRTAEHPQTIWQEIRSNPRVIGYSFLANAGVLSFGFDILVTGAVTALPAFSVSYGEQYNGKLILPALWQGLWTAFIQLGIMMGAASGGVFQDRFGRRSAFGLGGILTAIGTALAYSSPEVASLTGRRVLFLLSKIVTGNAIGILLTTCQTYVSEIAPTKLRPVLLAIFPFSVAIGQLVAVSVVFSRVLIFDTSSFQIPFAAMWAFSGLTIIAAVVIPESPTMLMASREPELARKAYLRLHGSVSDVDATLSGIKDTLNHEHAADEGKDASFAECFRRTDRRRTLIIILVALLQYLLGVSLLANSNYFLIMAGMSPTQSLQISQIGVGVQLVATVIASFTMVYLGRRTIVLWSAFATAVMFVAMGAAGFFENDTRAVRFIGVSIIIVGTISQLGVGATWPVLIGELSSSRLRARSSAIGFIINALAGVVFSISVPYMFNADAGNLGGKIGFVFAGLSFLGFGLSWIFLPETKNKTFDELNHLFEMHTPARRFAKS